MRISRGTGVLVLVVITVAIGVLVVGASWFFVSHKDLFSDQKKRSEIQRIYASARVYHQRLDFYDGACADVVAGLDYDCNDSSGSFASEVLLSNGSYYCTDSTGFIGEIASSIQGMTSCEKE